MKAINKTLNLATEYKNWLDHINHENNDHPKYTSSNGRYYYDIVANLLWVQKGLCDYTEMFLIDPERVNPGLWKDGRFQDFDFLGQLDHYDSKLKTTKGWNWNNLFMIHTDINTKLKRSLTVNYFLKPDKVGYDPFYLLDYDLSTHLFLPNLQREQDVVDKVMEDIFALGLNYEPITDLRKIYLSPILNNIDYGFMTPDDARNEIHSFYTAFEMALTKI